MNNEKPTGRAIVIETIMFFTYAFFAVSWIAGSTLTPQIMEYFQLETFASATLISNAVTIAKIIGNFLAAGILAKLYPKKAIGLGSLLIVLGCAMAVIAPAYWVFILGRFIMGFGGALYVVYFSPVVIHYFSNAFRPAVNAINNVAYNVGSVIAMIIVAPIIAWLNTWQYSMAFFACISLVLFILWLVFGENFELAAKTDAAVKYTVFDAMKEKLNWILPFTYSGLLTFYLVLLNIFPISGLCAIDSKTLSTLMAVGGIAGSLMAIWMGKRVHKRIPVIRWSGLAMTVLGALMLFTPNGIIAACSSFLIGLFMFLPVGSLMMIPQELPGMSAGKLTAVMGLFWAVSYIIETIVYFIIGFVIDGSGYMAGLLLALAASITFFAGSFLLPETGKE